MDNHDSLEDGVEAATMSDEEETAELNAIMDEMSGADFDPDNYVDNFESDCEPDEGERERGYETLPEMEIIIHNCFEV